ncbi:hypothetical protein L0N12_20520, partial [Escherichia coli]
MLPRIRHNNFIGAVELFVKSSDRKST